MSAPVLNFTSSLSIRMPVTCSTTHRIIVLATVASGLGPAQNSEWPYSAGKDQTQTSLASSVKTASLRCNLLTKSIRLSHRTTGLCHHSAQAHVMAHPLSESESNLEMRRWKFNMLQRFVPPLQLVLQMQRIAINSTQGFMALGLATRITQSKLTYHWQVRNAFAFKAAELTHRRSCRTAV